MLLLFYDGVGSPLYSVYVYKHISNAILASSLKKTLISRDTLSVRGLSWFFFYKLENKLDKDIVHKKSLFFHTLDICYTN